MFSFDSFRSFFRNFNALLRTVAVVACGFLFNQTWTMSEHGEHLAALIMTALAVVFAFTAVYGWTGVPQHPTASRVLKWIVFCVAAVWGIYSAIVIWRNKGTAPWTILNWQDVVVIQAYALASWRWLAIIVLALFAFLIGRSTRSSADTKAEGHALEKPDLEKSLSDNLRGCQDERLHKVAESDRSRIRDLVRVAAIYYDPSFDKAYIVFAFTIFNGSLYDIVISNVIKSGSIRFRFDEEWDWEKFHYKPRFEPENPILCRARGSCSFVIRQAIRREEADRFQQKHCLIDFALLEIHFEGLDKSNEIVSTRLDLSQLYLETKQRALRHTDSLDLVFMYNDEQWTALKNGYELAALRDRVQHLQEAIKPRKLIFQIDEERSQVHLERAGEDTRRIKAEVRLRCERSISEPVAVKAFHAALWEETDHGDVVLIEQETSQVVSAEPNMNVVSMDNGWTINEPLSLYRWFMFFFDISDKLEAKLSRKHFIRITMTAVAQNDRSIDFYVDGWNYSNSHITLR